MLVNASAIGFYGDTGENVVDEFSTPGNGFLADVCREWEAEAARATSCGVRVVFVRIGFVLGKGGALKLLRPLFKLGLGGKLGSGRQWMSGVHVEDVAGMIVWALENERLHGPVNAVMPEPFRNADFTRSWREASRGRQSFRRQHLPFGSLSVSLPVQCSAAPACPTRGA